MGKASFTVGRRSRFRDVMDTTVITSGAFTTSTTAANIEDAGGDISLRVGQSITIHADEAMRVAFGGTAATASAGHYIAATSERSFECTEPGVVSVIDVA